MNILQCDLPYFAEMQFKRKRLDQEITLEPHINLSHIQKRQRRSKPLVQFNEDVKVTFIETNDEINHEERKSRWYQEDELLSIRLLILDFSISFRGFRKSLPESVLNSSMICHLDMESDSTRGIEHLCNPSTGRSRKAVKPDSRLAVFLEQGRQKALNRNDPYFLASVYNSFVHSATKVAIATASCGALMASSILGEGMNMK